MKRLNKVKIEWSSSFAYAIGLIATDGNLSPDGRHINFTSKDLALVETFKQALNLDNVIGCKARGGSKEKKYFVVQFGDKNFYDFLLSIGLTQAKSKILAKVTIPDFYFPDFLRGCFDGDGNINLARHIESRHLQLKLRLYSASKAFLSWIKDEIGRNIGNTFGSISISNATTVYVLSYGKIDALKILCNIYNNKKSHCLVRKYLVYKEFLDNHLN